MADLLVEGQSDDDDLPSDFDADTRFQEFMCGDQPESEEFDSAYDEAVFIEGLNETEQKSFENYRSMTPDKLASMEDRLQTKWRKNQLSVSEDEEIEKHLKMISIAKADQEHFSTLKDRVQFALNEDWKNAGKQGIACQSKDYIPPPVKGLSFKEGVTDNMLDSFIYDLGAQELIQVDYLDSNERAKVIKIMRTGEGQVVFIQRNGSLQNAYWLARHLPLTTTNFWAEWKKVFVHGSKSFDRQPSRNLHSKKSVKYLPLMKKCFSALVDENL